MAYPFLVISLDLELNWGVRDNRALSEYGPNILGVREAIPKMLEVFRRENLSATIAALGLLAFSTKREMMQFVPERRPAYSNRSLDPYATLSEVGADETSDPYHFGYSLLRQIQDAPGMEIGTHTFGHYYCLEAGADRASLMADIGASQAALARLGVTPTSIVFPRNQYCEWALSVAAEAGLTCFRGNPDHHLYRSRPAFEKRFAGRAGRLLDAYINLSGHQTVVPTRTPSGLTNVAASRFFRPYSVLAQALEPLRLNRILTSMTRAAEEGRGYHLWWHPHNFGRHLDENIRNLETVIGHYQALNDRYGMTSMTMTQAADLLAQDSGQRTTSTVFAPA